MLQKLIVTLMGVCLTSGVLSFISEDASYAQEASIMVSQRPVVIFGANSNLEGLKVADVNGDGRADCLTRTRNSDIIDVAISQGEMDFRVEKLSGIRRDFDWENMLVGNLDRDGRADAIAFEAGSRRFSIFLGTEDARFQEFPTNTEAPVAKKIIPILAGSLQSWFLLQLADGSYDFFAAHLKGSKSDVLNLGKRNFSAPWVPLKLVSEKENEGPVSYIADIEGDDLFVGAGENFAFFPGSKPGEWQEILLGDFNGDKSLDVFARHSGLSGWWVAYGRNGTFIEKQLTGQTVEVRSFPGITVGDFNGDGADELLGFNVHDGKYTLITPNRNVNFEADPVCIGYNPAVSQLRKWGRIAGSSCPDGFAVLETANMSKKKREESSSGDWPFYPMLCCKLPEADILLSRSAISENRCPENSIVTGRRCSKISRSCREQLECTAINSQRFQLGKSQRGQQWGFFWSITKPLAIQRTDLPVAIRHGVGRLDYARWDLRGCIGNPVGALLVGIGDGCDGTEFAELQYRGILGDPPAGTPVRMFPDCNGISNVFDTTPHCVE